MKEQERKKKKNSGVGAFIVLALAVLSGIAESGGDVGLIVGVLMSIFIPVGLILLVISKVKKAAGLKGVSAPARHRPTKRWESELEDRPSVTTPSSNLREYSEYAAEEGFLRDKQRRIDQLDVFLKNGIIEKDEYRILKERYSK